MNVEDHAHDPAFGGATGAGDWDACPSRVERNVDVLLELLERHRTAGTFFVPADVAERHPSLVHRIATAGHEVAAYGQPLQSVGAQEEAEFREEIRTSRAILEDLCGRAIMGYRAPFLSRATSRDWFVNALLEEGYVYDSSPTDLRPGPDSASDGGGPSVPHYVDGSAGMLVRFPIPATRWWGLRLPVSGGEHLRYTPYAVTRDAFRDHTRSGVPGVFFLRAWEVDSAPPRLGAPLVARIRHRWGIAGMMAKVEQLLMEFHFSSCARVLDDAYTAGSRGPVFPTTTP